MSFPVSRDDVLARLDAAGISARRGIMAAHLEPAYAAASGQPPRDRAADAPVTDPSALPRDHRRRSGSGRLRAAGGQPQPPGAVTMSASVVTPTASLEIPLVDLAAQHREVADLVSAGFERVMSETAFIGGAEVADLREGARAVVGSRARDRRRQRHRRPRADAPGARDLRRRRGHRSRELIRRDRGSRREGGRQAGVRRRRSRRICSSTLPRSTHTSRSAREASSPCISSVRWHRWRTSPTSWRGPPRCCSRTRLRRTALVAMGLPGLDRAGRGHELLSRQEPGRLRRRGRGPDRPRRVGAAYPTARQPRRGVQVRPCRARFQLPSRHAPGSRARARS